MRNDDPPQRWGAFEMTLTVIGVLAGVAVGAFIFYLATQPRGQLGAALAVDITPTIERIRQHIRAASQAATPTDGLVQAASAMALLDSLEAVHGPEEIARVANPRKLRRLIVKLQDQYQSGGAESERPKLTLVK